MLPCMHLMHAPKACLHNPPSLHSSTDVPCPLVHIIYCTASKYRIFVWEILGLLGIFSRFVGTLPNLPGVQCLDLVRYFQVLFHLTAGGFVSNGLCNSALVYLLTGQKAISDRTSCMHAGEACVLCGAAAGPSLGSLRHGARATRHAWQPRLLFAKQHLHWGCVCTLYAQACRCESWRTGITTLALSIEGRRILAGYLQFKELFLADLKIKALKSNV